MKKNYFAFLAFLLFMGMNSLNAQTIILSQDFAGGTVPAGWTNTAVSGVTTWEYTTIGSAGGTALASTSAANGYFMVDSDNGVADDGIAENTDLITASFSCAGQSNVRIQFQQVFQQYGASTGTVAVRVGAGAWNTVYTVGPALAQNASTTNAELVDLDISAFAGNQTNVQVRFKYQGNWDYWWMIDDIFVYAPSAYDVAVTDANIGQYTAVPLSQVTSYTPSCEITNLGANAASNVSVVAKITNGANATVFTSTMTQASLAVGAVSTLTSATSFTPSAVDFYLVEYIVSITQADADATNDTLYTGLDITDSLYARDYYYLTGNTNQLDGPWFLGATATGELGNTYRATTATKLVSVTALFSGGFAIGDQVKAKLYSMNATTPNALLASSAVLTVTAQDTPVFFHDFIFPANTNLTANTNYFVSIEQYAAAAPNFGLYSSPFLYTQNTSFLKVGTGAWQEILASGLGDQTFVIRANVYSPTACAISDVSPGTQTACANNQYTQQVTVTYTSAPATGTLNVNGQTFAITSSPQTVTLTGLTANSAAVNVTANFSALPACTYTENSVFTAPAPCSCNISNLTAGTQTACVNNQYTQQVIVNYTNAPASGTLNVGGQTFAISSSPQTVTLTGLTANSAAVNLTASFSATPACTYSENAVFTAPAPCACNITNLTAGTQTPCVSSNNQYTQQVIVNYANAPTSGTLNVGGQTFAITSSPQTVTLTGLTANGASVNLTASFSASPSCTYSENAVFTAPAACSCSISDLAAGTQTACVGSTNNYTQQVIVTYANAPGSGLLNVNGQTFSISSSPQTVTLVGLTSNGAAVNTTASFTATPACTYTENALFTAPASCLCPSISVSVSTTPVANCNAPNGTATASASGGSGSYTYTWTPSSFGSGPTISGLPSGTYTVIASDANGCTGTASGSVTNTSGINAAVSSLTPILCNGASTGAISISTTGGSAPITYNWSDQGFNSTVSSRTGLPAGPYTVVVTDGGNCTVTLGPINITQPAPLVANLLSSTNISCNGLTNGAIDMSVTGGTTNYSYAWSNSTATTVDLNSLGAGSYQLTVTDANSCTTTGPLVVITEPAAIVVNVTASADISCNGLTDGAIDVTVTGGQGTLTYNWGAGNPATEDLSGLDAGTYQVSVTDQNLCSVTSPSITIVEPNSLGASISSSDESAPGSANGSATVSPNGGTGSYTYSWNDGANQTTATASNLSAGTYVCTITDGNGCTSSVNVTVDLANAIKDLALAELKIFPNPTAKYVTISFETIGNDDYSIRFYNTIGKSVITENASVNRLYNNTFDLSKLASGVYFVEIGNEKGKTTQRIVLNK